MPSPASTQTGFRSGLKVSAELLELSNRPGFLSVENGGQRMRNLYVNGSMGFNPTQLTRFGLSCYLGDFDEVKKLVGSGAAHDICGYETEYRFGYLTLTVAGSQRVMGVASGPEKAMRHADVIKYLLDCGATPDLPDIAGYTALHHATVTNPKVHIARILLEGGANVNHQNKYGSTALMEASQAASVSTIDLLLEFGADMDIADADGIKPSTFYLQAGPEVTAVVMKWVRKRNGEQAGAMESKRCDGCGSSPGARAKLLLCSRCHAARYCNSTCQKVHWPGHKAKCRAFQASNTITVTPHYENLGNMMPQAAFTRKILGMSSDPIPERSTQSANRHPAEGDYPKSLIIKVQVPFAGFSATPEMQAISQERGHCLVYTKRRDLSCLLRRAENGAQYDRLVQTIKSRGVGGLKAYFPAEMKSKGSLVIKVGEILAEQPF